MKATDSSSKLLLVVQEPELNRYVDLSVPVTWEKRWKLLRLLLPVIVFGFVLSAEDIIAHVWADGDRLSDHLAKILGGPIAIVGICILGMELVIWSNKKIKRSIELDIKGIRLSITKLRRIPWQCLSSWTLEPVPSEPGLQKLTLRYAWDKKGRQKRSWSLVLKQSEQTDALNKYIEHLKETGMNVPTLITRTAPIQRNVIKKVSSLDSWIVVVSCLLLINGFSLLAGGIALSNENPGAPSHTHAVPNELDRFVIRHFSSPEEFRRFLLFTGGGLILVGGFLLIYETCNRPKNTGAGTNKEPNAP